MHADSYINVYHILYNIYICVCVCVSSQCNCPFLGWLCPKSHPYAPSETALQVSIKVIVTATLDSHIHPFAMISSEHHLLRTYMSSANIQPIQSVYVFFRWSTFKCSCARRYRFFTATRGLTRMDLVFPCPAIPSQNHSMRSPLIKPLVCATKSWWSTPKPKLSTVVANILCK